MKRVRSLVWSPAVICLALLLSAETASAAPCITAAGPCTEWVTRPGGPARLLVYRSYSLDSRNERLTRALIVIHGGSRDADSQFRTGLAAAFLAGALADTNIIAPRFASSRGKQAGNGRECHDALASNEADWVCETEASDSWRFGGVARGTEQPTAYDFIDEILQKLSRKDVFPNLKAIVVAGHSGGGIFTTRYEMANRLHEKLGVSITYVAANATNYAYPDATRPTASAYPISAAAPGYMPPIPAGLAPFSSFADARNCATYNDWPYGLTHRTGYAATIADDRLRQQLVARPVTYVLGELDLVPLATGDDLSCSAAAQGPTRLARGLAFGKYVNEYRGAHHNTIMITGCGHNARCIFTAEQVLPLIFPTP